MIGAASMCRPLKPWRLSRFPCASFSGLIPFAPNAPPFSKSECSRIVICNMRLVFQLPCFYLCAVCHSCNQSSTPISLADVNGQSLLGWHLFQQRQKRLQNSFYAEARDNLPIKQKTDYVLVT